MKLYLIKTQHNLRIGSGLSIIRPQAYYGVLTIQPAMKLRELGHLVRDILVKAVDHHADMFHETMLQGFLEGGFNQINPIYVHQEVYTDLMTCMDIENDDPIEYESVEYLKGQPLYLVEFTYRAEKYILSEAFLLSNETEAEGFQGLVARTFQENHRRKNRTVETLLDTGFWIPDTVNMGISSNYRLV